MENTLDQIVVWCDHTATYHFSITIMRIHAKVRRPSARKLVLDPITNIYLNAVTKLGKAPTITSLWS